MLPFNMSVVSRKTVEIERRLCAFRQTLKTYRERICFLMHHSFRTAFTHGGKFHADDVFSAALLRILFPGIVIQRGFRVPQPIDGIVFDIGEGPFDHHQAGAPVRPNGVPYAAFGLLWREYGPSLVGEEAAAHFDESFIQSLDLDDNTGCGCQLAGVIATFNPAWNSDQSFDSCFVQAVELAQNILQHQLDAIHNRQQAQQYVQDAYQMSRDKRMVYLPRFAPWKKTLVPTEAQFVLYPSVRGGYSAQVIPKAMDTNEAKCYFPESWAGKPQQQLPEISGIPTLTFCHNSRFLISAGKLEDAYLACRKAMETQAP